MAEAITIEQLQRDLEYAYRCINEGFRSSTFDFSVLRRRAADYLENKPNGAGIRRALLEQ